jgi:hypothetical protein
VLGIPKRLGRKITLADRALQPIAEDEHYLRLAILPGQNQIEARYD